MIAANDCDGPPRRGAAARCDTRIPVAGGSRFQVSVHNTRDVRLEAAMAAAG
jgi:hypothetical protein